MAMSPFNTAESFRLLPRSVARAAADQLAFVIDQLPPPRPAEGRPVENKSPEGLQPGGEKV
jgi:hypothetical protein